MRKTLIAALFAATLPALAMAMPDSGPHHGGDHGQRPFQSLNLTKEQRQEVRQLMGEEMKSHREITDKYLKKLSPADQKAMQDELKTQRDKTQAAIRAKLTPEQQKQFDEQKKKMEAKRAEWNEFQAWKAQKDKSAQ